MACEQEFDFTLVLSGIDEVTEDVEDALFAAGCDDATLSVRHGRPYLTFSRQASSFEEAVLSAIENVRESDAKVNVLQVDDCSLVTQAEIARLAGCSRQLVKMYITGERGPGHFPGPVCGIADKHPLWMWCEVSYWLYQHNMIREEVFNQAEVIEAINWSLETKRVKERMSAILEKVFRRATGTSSGSPEDKAIKST